MDLDHPICFETWLNIPSLKCLMQCFYESATFSLQIRLPSIRIRWIRHTNPHLFEPALQSGNFWIRYESGIVWKLNPDMFFLPGDPRWCNKIKPSPLTWKAEQDANFARFTTQALLPIFPEVSWVLEWIIWIQIRVDVEIYKSGIRERMKCGRGLRSTT